MLLWFDKIFRAGVFSYLVIITYQGIAELLINVLHVLPK